MPTMSRRELLKLGGIGAAGLLSFDLLAGCGRNDSGQTTVDATSLNAFRSDAAKTKPTGLPDRIGWASTADSEFFLALGRGIEQAATHRGVDYVTATSGNDPGKHVDQMNAMLKKGVGSLAVQPLSPDAESLVLENAIADGTCTQGIITAPSTMQVVASQYQIGFDQGKAAADYVLARLGGEAQVLYFNLDTASPQLKIRHRGVLDGLKTGGAGIKVAGDLTVADISTSSGFNTMMSALGTHKEIKVVMGGDTIVVGAYKALKETGKLNDDMYLSGVDGDTQALELVKAGGAYKLSIGFAWSLMGYGLGQFGADWIEGKDVPRLIVARGVKLDSVSTINTFTNANEDPASVFANRSQYESYLPLYGNVSHAKRNTYWTTPVDPPPGSA